MLNFSPLDFNQLASITEMDYEDVVQLMTIYEYELKKDLNTLETHFIHKQFSGISEVVHKIKGDSSNLALADLVRLAKEIEKDLRDHHYNHLASEIDRLWAYHTLIQMSLRKLSTKENE